MSSGVVEVERAQKRWAGGELLLYAAMQLALVSVAYKIDRRRKVPLVATSSWAILLGLACGAVLALLSKRRVDEAGLDPQILFFGLLPPIIFEAGINTQRKGFFSNIVAILLLAVAGTLIAAFATGGVLIWLGSLNVIPALTAAEAFMFGALISAVDPVTTLLVLKKCRAPPLLFNLVFGESVLNDAAAIVLFTLFQQVAATPDAQVDAWTVGWLSLRLMFIIVGSVLLSGAICYSSAYLLHHADPALRQHPTYEISTLLLSAYASYLAAELVELSGILAVFFSGVFIRHYHAYNVSKASAFAFKHLLATLAFLAENFIYLYLGISVFAYRDAFVWNWPFILASFGACLLARALNVFPLCAFANLWRSARHQIPVKYMGVIWFSGLRGAVAFALVLNAETMNPTHAAMLKSSTIFNVLVTTMVFGALVGPSLQLFNIGREIRLGRGLARRQHAGERSDVESGGERQPLLPPPPSAPSSPPSLRSVRAAWVKLDETYLKPVFGGRPRPACEEPTTQLLPLWEE